MHDLERAMRRWEKQQCHKWLQLTTLGTRFHECPARTIQPFCSSVPMQDPALGSSHNLGSGQNHLVLDDFFLRVADHALRLGPSMRISYYRENFNMDTGGRMRIGKS